MRIATLLLTTMLAQTSSGHSSSEGSPFVDEVVHLIRAACQMAKHPAASACFGHATLKPHAPGEIEVPLTFRLVHDRRGHRLVLATHLYGDLWDWNADGYGTVVEEGGAEQCCFGPSSDPYGVATAKGRESAPLLGEDWYLGTLGVTDGVLNQKAGRILLRASRTKDRQAAEELYELLAERLSIAIRARRVKVWYHPRGS